MIKTITKNIFKNGMFLTLLLSFGINIYGQDKTTLKIEKLYKTAQYDKIIDKYAYKAEDISSSGVYFIGMSYFFLKEDQKALQFFNLSIEKDAFYPESFYMKGVVLTYLGQYDLAIDNIENAIELGSENSALYSALGDAYLNSGDANAALEAYLKAKEFPNPADRPFVVIPQIYGVLGDTAKAITNYYVAKERINKESTAYYNVLYNLGIYEYFENNHVAAENVLTELINLQPNDYQSYAKLIQVYYAQKKYTEADKYKTVLYKAHKNKLLQGTLANMFCFDQFAWNEFQVQAFERYEEEEGELYYKHLFYVLNKEGEIQFRLQTENSPLAEEQGRPAFAIGKNTDNMHFTYAFVNKADLNYDLLKSLIIRILNGEIEPISNSSTD
jgi:tetratricopeptide (TPR) repeat protein